jgi:hypothetical protein
LAGDFGEKYQGVYIMSLLCGGIELFVGLAVCAERSDAARAAPLC